MSKLINTLIGNFAHYASQLLLKSLRVSIYRDPEIDPIGQYAYGFWHDKQFAPIMLMTKFGNQKHLGLVSTSGDGDMLCIWLKRLGYHVVRGSSSRKGISSLVKLLAAAKEGYSIGITADGPRGPRYEAKAGLGFIAAKAGLQIIPLGVAYSIKWQFEKSWDKYQLPLPFSKVVFYLGKPMSVAGMTDQAVMNTLIAEGINAADKEAQLILAGQPALLPLLKS